MVTGSAPALERVRQLLLPMVSGRAAAKQDLMALSRAAGDRIPGEAAGSRTEIGFVPAKRLHAGSFGQCMMCRIRNTARPNGLVGLA